MSRLSSLRRGPRWRNEGEDPDYRFSLANERTFLAWIRTSLGLLAGAVVVAHLVDLGVTGLQRAIGIGLALAGTATGALAYRHWAANERAMRVQQPLPHTPMLLLLTIIMVAVGTAAFLVVVA